MDKRFFDYEKGEFCTELSDDMAVDSEGNRLMRLSDSMALDMEKGELHMVSGWSRDDD